ncbi:ATP-binding protein [Amycolatopsis sp. NPDC004368]
MCSARDAGGNHSGELNLDGRALLEDATAMRFALADWAGERELPRTLIGDLELAAYEAMVNVAAHAYPDDHPGTLGLRATHDNCHLRVAVIDHGRWQPSRPYDHLHGRGLPLIHLLADHADVTATPHGTTVTMTWRVPES